MTNTTAVRAARARWGDRGEDMPRGRPAGDPCASCGATATETVGDLALCRRCAYGS